MDRSRQTGSVYSFISKNQGITGLWDSEAGKCQNQKASVQHSQTKSKAIDKNPNPFIRQNGQTRSGAEYGIRFEGKGMRFIITVTI